MAAVRDGRINIVPKTWEKTFFNWMENIQPWCVSRQLWWGHRIPAWYGPIIDDGGMKGHFSDSMRNRVFVAHDHDEMVEQFHEYYGADCRLLACETWAEYRPWWLAVMADAHHPGRHRQEQAENGRAACRERGGQ